MSSRLGPPCTPLVADVGVGDATTPPPPSTGSIVGGALYVRWTYNTPTTHTLWVFFSRVAGWHFTSDDDDADLAMIVPRASPSQRCRLRLVGVNSYRSP
jgi:hypothetical protein